MTKHTRTCVFFLSILMFATAAFAQNVATAELKGVVTDPNGAVVQSANVTARDESRGIERAATTNASGEYQFLNLQPGLYTVTAEAPGFAKTTVPSVRLTIGATSSLPIQLQIQAAATEVTVTSEAELIEPERSSETTTIGQTAIENLPINGRNYINFSLTDSKIYRDTAPSIGAAPTSGLNFSGQRARGNLVNVDGADNVDASVNGIRSTVSQEAVQEFQIITNGFNAEYGRASGGVVNIITKSGTNSLHGSVFGYLRNRHIQADNPFTNVENPAYTRVQAGATLGGPIKRDRTFFFFSVETTQRNETGFSTIGSDCGGGTSCFGLVPFNTTPLFGVNVPIQVTPAQATFLGNGAVPLAVRQQYAFLAGGSSGVALDGQMPAGFALLGLAPAGLGQFPTSCNALNPLCNGLPAEWSPLMNQRGNYPLSEDTTVLSFRLDHRFNNNNSMLVRFNYSPSEVTGIQVNAQNQPFGQNAFSRSSAQQFDDIAVTVQDSWLIGNNKVNEFRFQYARRDLLYDFNRAIPEGSRVAVNLVGFAFIGREPFSFVDRIEQRWQFADNFSWVKGNHTFKFGFDIQHLPLDAAFTVNFGNVFNVGALSATQVNPAFGAFGAPGFSPVQAYGLGIPSTMVQGIGNPNAQFSVQPMGFYVQDTWRIGQRLTLNLGVRYDVEKAPEFAFPNQLSADSYSYLNIQKGFRTDTNNIAPRVGIAWDPWGDGKTVFRANYGLFYDNPLLGLLFLGAATDGAGTPQLILFGGAPCTAAGPPSPLNLNATNVFQGILGTANCLPPGAATAMGFLPGRQQFDSFLETSTFVNQNFLGTQPLVSQPFGFPTGGGFEHAYTSQASLSLERELANSLSLGLSYNYAHGTHLNRPINSNPVRTDLLVQNWFRAVFLGGVPITTSPLAITTCNPAINVYPTALVNFFRPSGINPSMVPVFGAACTGFASTFLNSQGLGVNAPSCALSAQCVPFTDMVGNYSNGSSVYHGLSANLKKRMSRNHEFMVSYTWSHTIDDSTDLQSLLSPQNSYFASRERANSTFDQRHRLVFSGVFQTGRRGSGAWGAFLSDWTFSPLFEFSSGRPFTILTAEPVNFQFSPNSARPNVVPAGTTTNSCGFPVQASSYSPTGFFQTPCFINAVVGGGGTIALDALDGNLGRNSANKPYTFFNDLRIARRFNLGERVKLDAITDIFNLVNRFNVADVSLLCSSTNCNAGQPTAAFDPRQFQFGLKLTW